MARLFRLMIISVGMALILAAVAALVLAPRLDGVLKAAVERRLGYLYMTEVTVAEVKPAWFRQTLDMRGISILNPPTFRPKPAVTLDHVSVRFDLKSFLTEIPTIHEVFVKGIKVSLRYELGDGTNIGLLAKNAAEREKATSGAPVAEPKGLRRRIAVEKFACDGATIELSTNLLPLASPSVRIRPFTLKGFGEGNPVPAPRMAVLFLRSVMTEALTAKGLLKPVFALLTRELQDLS